MIAPWWQTRSFVALALLATAVPLLWPAVPPLTDLPGHMARYRVMLGDDPGLSRWYAFGWKPIGYLGVDLLVLAIAPVLGLECAVKLVAILIPVMTATGMLWLSREAHGRIQPLALFALPLAYHFYFSLGFLNFTLGMALALNALALWLRLGRLGRWRLRAVVFVAVGVLLWIAHVLSWIALIAMTGPAEIVQARAKVRTWLASVRIAALRCLPLAPPAVMVLLWHPGWSGVGSDYLASLPLKPGRLATVLRDRWQAFDIASIAAIGLLLYGCARSQDWRRSRPLLGAGAGLFLLFVALPFGAGYTDARFAPYLVMLLLLAPDAARLPVRRLQIVALAGLAFFGLRTAATTASFAIEGRDWDRRLAALDHVPRGARVIGFVTAPCATSWRMVRISHLPGMLVTRRGAFSNDQFDLGAAALLRVTAPGLRGFATDPSQMVVPEACAGTYGFRSLAQALGRFPRERFDYLWIMDPVRVDPRLLAGLDRVWSDGRDVLYRLPSARHSRTPPRPATSPLSTPPLTR